MIEARVAQRGKGVLREFNEAGVLEAADVHVALRLATLGGETREPVHLATALAVLASLCAWRAQQQEGPA